MPRRTGIYKDVAYTAIAYETPLGDWRWQLDTGGGPVSVTKFHPDGAMFPTWIAALDDAEQQVGPLIEQQLRNVGG